MRKKEFYCPMCSSRCASKNSLHDHIARHVKERKFDCDECSFSTHDNTCLTRHVAAMHKKSMVFKCTFPTCSYSTTHRGYIQKHQKIHDSDPAVRSPFPCTFPGCEFRANCKKDLNKHMNSRHNPNRTRDFNCPLCSKAFYSSAELNPHIKFVHTKDVTFKCNLCDFEIYYRNGLKDHLLPKHGLGNAREKKFKCDKCDYRSFSKHPLDLHKEAKHATERKVRCEYPGCEFQTTYHGSLKHHQLIHEKNLETQYPFSCSYTGCDFRSRLNYQMEKHRKNHVKSGIQLRCEFCTTFYLDRHSFGFHNSMVHNEKYYSCRICDYLTCANRKMAQHYTQSHQRKWRHSTCSGDVPAGKKVGRWDGCVVGLKTSSKFLKFRCGNCKFDGTDELSLLNHSVSHNTAVVILRRISLVKQ